MFTKPTLTHSATKSTGSCLGEGKSPSPPSKPLDKFEDVGTTNQKLMLKRYQLLPFKALICSGLLFQLTTLQPARADLVRYDLTLKLFSNQGPNQSSSDNGLVSGYIVWNTSTNRWTDWNILLTQDKGAGVVPVFRFTDTPATSGPFDTTFPPYTTALPSSVGCFNSYLNQGGGIPNNSAYATSPANGSECDGVFRGINNNPYQPRDPAENPTSGNGINWFSVYQYQDYKNPQFNQNQLNTANFFRIPFTVTGGQTQSGTACTYDQSNPSCYPVLAAAPPQPVNTNSSRYDGWAAQANGFPNPLCGGSNANSASGDPTLCPYGINQNNISPIDFNVAFTVTPPVKEIPAPLPAAGLLPLGIALKKLRRKRKNLIEAA